MSTVDDLLLWDRNFYANRLGKGTLVQELQTPGVLNNGNKISYAMRFPEQKFTVICLCNIASAVPENLARKIADLYLADKLLPGASALPRFAELVRKVGLPQ